MIAASTAPLSDAGALGQAEQAIRFRNRMTSPRAAHSGLAPTY